MNTLLGIILFLGTFWAAFWLARKVATGNRIFVICLGTVIFFSFVIINSWILSVYGSLSSYLGWIGLTIISCGLCYFVGKQIRPTLVGDHNWSVWGDFWTWYMPEGRLSKLAVFFSVYFGFVIGVQLLDILILAPSQWDSFTYIMPRVLFYLQNGNLNPYPTNDLPQIAHVTGWSQIQAFGLMITGRREFGFSMFSLALFCVGLLATMESGRILSEKSLGGWISGFVYASAVNVINLSSTPQSDMPIAGFLACGLLGVVVWIDRIRTEKDQAFSMVFAVLVAGSLGLAAVMKASALLALAAFAPIFFILAWNLIFPIERGSIKKVMGLMVAGAFIGITIFACGGYYSNFKNFGHPLGSEEWRAEHEFSDISLQERILEGGKNLARFGTHFLSLDGFYSGPPGLKNSPVRGFQKALSDVVKSGCEGLGWNLEESNHSRVPFRYFTEWPPKPISNADLSYPGIVFVIALGMSLLVWWQNRQSVPLNLLALIIICTAILYFCLQSFLALYDPWRGRSFSNLVVMLAPVCGMLAYASARFWKPALASLLILGTLQGASAIVFRDSGPLIALKKGQSTIFSPGDRAAQYSRFLDLIAPPKAYELRSSLRNYFWLLPESPNLATAINGGELVYPFLWDAKHNDYYKSEEDIPWEKYDAAIIPKSDASGKNFVEISQDLYLWRRKNVFPKRDPNDFDAFFGLEKINGIGQVEGPYGKHVRSFRLMTNAKADLQFRPIADQSTLFFEISSAEVPNQLEIIVNGKLLEEINLVKKGRIYGFSFNLDTTEKSLTNVELIARAGLDDAKQNRKLYGFIYRLSLIPRQSY